MITKAILLIATAAVIIATIIPIFLIVKFINKKPTKKDLLREQNELLKKQIELLEQDRKG